MRCGDQTILLLSIAGLSVVACKSAGPVQGDMHSALQQQGLALPAEEMELVIALIDGQTQAQMMSVGYGPEWRSLTVTDRRLKNGILTCTHHSEIPDDISGYHLTPDRWYSTADDSAISLFNSAISSLVNADEMPPYDSRLRSSNPSWVAHITFDPLTVVRIPYPYSVHGHDTFAIQSVVIDSALEAAGKRVPTGSNTVVLGDWVEPRRWLKHSSRSRDLTLSFSSAYLLNLALPIFDLQQRGLHLLAQDNGENVRSTSDQTLEH